MKRILIIFISTLLLFGCTNYDGYINKTVVVNESKVQIDHGGKQGKSLDIEELKSLSNSALDEWGYYKSVLAFLSGDAKTMSECGKYSVYDGLTEKDYEEISKIKIDWYEITELKSKDLDFKFTVSESECDRFPVGEYHYQIGVMWNSMGEKSYDSKYDELLELIRILAADGSTAWENGELTYDDNGLGFDFSVVRAIQWYANKNDLSDFEGTTEDYAKFAEQLFGIKDFVPQSEYLKLVDGKWEYTTYVNRISIMHSVTDIRETGNKIEVDIQYFADTYGIIPAHSVTVFITQTEDEMCKYSFEKSVVTEKGEHKPLRWSV